MTTIIKSFERETEHGNTLTIESYAEKFCKPFWRVTCNGIVLKDMLSSKPNTKQVERYAEIADANFGHLK